ncbi:hypothetical protein [Dyella sp. 2HG41-7]|uniref:hypothetical protein n=1 Tax=Dyella sp. 2HG41-7 TaxID=2883239 RepID=UPI001F296D64|nr:hypothetical protein [Dyella sp. 2HG41-7]
MNTRTLLFMLAGTTCAMVGVAQAAPPMHDMGMTAQDAPSAAPKLQAAMRSLWHGHVVHTREYAMAVHAHDNAKAKAAADAVVANAKQIANAVAGFYGKPAGAQTLQLLAGHWGGVKALTDASAANDMAGEQKAMTDLNNNVNDIAKFFSSANPNLPENAVQSLFAAHVAHHATQIRQIMSGDTKGEEATWTEMQAHMNTIADALSNGIAKQFPDKAK